MTAHITPEEFLWSGRTHCLAIGECCCHEGHLPCLKQCFGRSKKINTNAGIQHFPVEYCAVGIWSMLFTSTLVVLNVVANQYLSYIFLLVIILGTQPLGKLHKHGLLINSAHCVATLCITADKYRI